MDAVINENTGSWDVIFGSWVKIASDHQTPVSDLLAHEFGHQGDFEASVQEAGYENLDMQLNLTWDRMQRHGKRNGWSADETRRRALGAVKTQFETAYKKIKTIYEKKKAKRDQRNGHGIDPDGLFGPQSDPCDGKGPLCGGGAL